MAKGDQLVVPGTPEESVVSSDHARLLVAFEEAANRLESAVHELKSARVEMKAAQAAWLARKR